MAEIYLNDPQLRAAGTPYSYTQEQVKEIIRCQRDPIYFIETYLKVEHVDHGLIPFIMFDYQKEMILSYVNNRNTICNLARQLGKTTCTAAFFCWYTIFNEHKTCGILGNKALLAREILNRYQIMYRNLPKFLQQGVVSWNKGSVELENGSRILTAATSANAARGFSFSVLYLDEFAHVHTNIAEEFFTSVFPTLSSGKTTKVIINSTPLGFNLFHKMYKEAEQGKNGFHPITYDWTARPDRDKHWKDDQLKKLGPEKFAQEHLVEFLGSQNTLIHSRYIKAMVADTPLSQQNGVTVYKKAEPGRKYVLVCDPAEGTRRDDHAIIIYDISEYPIRIVAKYVDNTISHLVLPGVIEKLAKHYNKANVLIEQNSIGGQVINSLHMDFEYENIVRLYNGDMGLRTTKATKAQGCALFRDLIENQKLIVNDLDLISQISTFIQVRNSYEADEGFKDDLVMCCVLFSWFTATMEFKDLFDKSLQELLQQQSRSLVHQDIVPFGIIDDGLHNAFMFASEDEQQERKVPQETAFEKWLRE